jgi:acetyltransferase-like isoleucine patch superfamily enzyme
MSPLRSAKHFVRDVVRRVAFRFLPEVRELAERASRGVVVDSKVSPKARLYPPFEISGSTIGDFTYIARGASISDATIGAYCSIGPNLLCGWGIHPTDTLSTSPMFYSTRRQNGTSLSAVDKIAERAPISIGNDVFIGMNVTILDGVTIGDGAVIGAGAVVSKDIPPFAVAYGNPIEVRRFRFEADRREALQRIAWWRSDFPHIQDVERFFDDVDSFVIKHDPARMEQP